MAARQIYDPEGFRNIETDGRITGYPDQHRWGVCKKGRYPFYGKWGDIYHGGDADGY